jgi:hypothetical protein
MRNPRTGWVNPDAARKIARSQQRRGYVSGEALRHHADAVHGGLVLDSCPACQEIQRRMKCVK